MIDELLGKAEQAIEAKLTVQARQEVMRVVTAGLQVAMKGGPDSIIAKIKDSQDPVDAAARGATVLVGLMAKQSRGTMPPRAFAPAAVILMLHALDFAQKLGMIKVDNQVIAEGTKKITDYILQAHGITNGMLNKMASASHGVMQDPQAMRRLHQDAGVVPHPGAGPPVGGTQGGGTGGR